MILKTKHKTNEYDIIIDDEDFIKIRSKKIHLKSDFKTENKYAQFKMHKRNVKLHRFILNVTDPSIHVDHINGNTLDNRKMNLRICSRFENMRNTKSRKGSSSQYLGVYWNPTLNYWVAEVRFERRRVYCGYFKSEVEAARKRDEVAKQFHGEFVRLNFNE